MQLMLRLEIRSYLLRFEVRGSKKERNEMLDEDLIIIYKTKQNDKFSQNRMKMRNNSPSCPILLFH